MPSNHTRPLQTPARDKSAARGSGSWRIFMKLGLVSLLGALIPSISGCTPATPAPTTTKNVLQTVAAESQYASVIRDIGGNHVSVYTIIANPNVDPHEFQVGPADAKMIGNAALVVQNGLGYDSFMQQLEQATKNSKRTVIDAGSLVGGKTGSTNPHLWYQPGNMETVAEAVTQALSQHDGKDKALFEQNLQKFKESLKPWQEEIQLIQKQFPGGQVAVTEPVADDLLKASGLTIRTPWSFEAAVMNGVDPSPQSVAEQTALLTNGRVKVLVYNPQAGDSITTSLLQIAQQHHIPIVGAYETLPHGHNYATWMFAETKAIYNALNRGQSMETMQ